MEHARVILNPSAAAGRGLSLVSPVGKALERLAVRHEIVLTRGPGHATELAQHARADGVDVIVVVGGDGTLSEVTQAYVDDAGEAVEGPDIALVPCGIRSDFARTMAISGATEHAVSRVSCGTRRAVDLGIASFHDDRGRSLRRPFVNALCVGLGARIGSVSRKLPAWAGTRGAQVLATLEALARHRHQGVRVSVDGAVWHEGSVLGVTVSNGRYVGGGMMIAPHADPTDGRVDVVALGDLSPSDVLLLAPRIYRGTHVTAECVSVGSGEHVALHPIHPWAKIAVELDGDPVGLLPLDARLCAAAVTLRA